MQRTYTNLIIHVISDAGVLRMRRAFNQFCIDGHCAPWSGLMIFLVVLTVAFMLMLRLSSTITVQETLLVALYTVHRVVEKSSTLISTIPLGTWEGVNAGSQKHIIKSFWSRKKKTGLDFNLIHSHTQSRHAPMEPHHLGSCGILLSANVTPVDIYLGELRSFLNKIKHIPRSHQDWPWERVLRSVNMHHC